MSKGYLSETEIALLRAQNIISQTALDRSMISVVQIELSRALPSGGPQETLATHNHPERHHQGFGYHVHPKIPESKS